MRKISAIILQMVIFIAAWFSMTPDQLIDNTHLFGLFGDVEITKGNTVWVLAGAAILSALNIWVWWPKSREVVNTSSESSTPVAAETKSAKAEEVKAEDPVVPKMD